MAEFKTIISDPKTRRAFNHALSESDSSALIGRSIGDKIDGIFVNLPGYRLQITGGSDGSGVPDSASARWCAGRTSDRKFRS